MSEVSLYFGRWERFAHQDDFSGGKRFSISAGETRESEHHVFHIYVLFYDRHMRDNYQPRRTERLGASYRGTSLIRNTPLLGPYSRNT